MELNVNEKLKLFLEHCRKGSIEDVQNFLSQGEIELNDAYFTKKQSNLNPLCCAVESDNIDLVKILLKYVDLCNICLSDFGAILNVACQKGNRDIAELLINCGPDDFSFNNFERGHPLYYAVFKKHVSIVKLLLEKGNGSKYPEHGGSIISGEWRFGDFDSKALEIMKLLLHQNIIDADFLFSRAVIDNDISLTKFFIEEGVDVNLKFRTNGLTPLCAAIEEHSYGDRSEMIRILLKSGADPSIICRGRTPLVWSSYATIMKNGELHTDFSIMEMLLKFGADINGTDLDGNTALHLCVKNFWMAFLISRGINTEIKNNENKTAAEVFKFVGWDKGGLLAFYKESMEEISKMKSTILNTYGLTLHNILSMNRHDLSNYINNVNLLTILEDPMFSKNFPIFGDILKEKFRQGKERKKIMNSASQFLENVIGVKIPELVSKSLFKYFSDSEISSTFLK